MLLTRAINTLRPGPIEPRRVFPEGSGRECRHETLSLLTAVECLLELHRRNLPEWLQEAVVIEPPDPLKGGEFHVFQPAQGPRRWITFVLNPDPASEGRTG